MAVGPRVQVTVSNTAIWLSSISQFTPYFVQGYSSLPELITIVTEAPLRITRDGIAPTTSSGELLAAGTWQIRGIENILKLAMIRNGSVDAPTSITLNG